MPPLPVSADSFEVQEYQQQFDIMPQLYQDLQQFDFMSQAQPYPQIDGLTQLSNQEPEEYHLATLQQQQVEQVQPHGNLPRESQKLTNSYYHLHQGNGATASSSGSSSKRRRENESRGKGKEREVVVEGNRRLPSTSSKRKRDEAGDETGAGGSGSSQ